MNEAMLFGKLLRSTRKAHKLSLGKLAEMTSTDPKHLGRLERGERHPSFKLIISLSNAMNVSPSVFFEFEASQVDHKTAKRQIQLLLDATDVTQLPKTLKILRAVLQS